MVPDVSGRSAEQAVRQLESWEGDVAEGPAALRYLPLCNPTDMMLDRCVGSFCRACSFTLAWKVPSQKRPAYAVCYS